MCAAIPLPAAPARVHSQNGVQPKKAQSKKFRLATSKRAADAEARSVTAADETPERKARRARKTIVAGAGGDHPAIQQFLAAVFQAPSADDFQASLEDPFYEPSDRLLVKHRARILAHVHLTHRITQLEELRAPTAGLFRLGVLPECRGANAGTRLLAAAERKMRQDGATAAMLQTHIPHFFHDAGWAVCGRHSHSQANARRLLGLLSQPSASADRRRRVSVRPWRQVELAALIRLYQRGVDGASGPYERTEAYWRWIVSRKDFDQIYVAIEGPDRFAMEQYDCDGRDSPIVGYAVSKGHHVLELFTAPGHATAARQLMARMCHEAIEQDAANVVLHAAPFDPLHGVFKRAGGVHHHHEMHQEEVMMVKLIDRDAFLRSLGPLLDRRATDAGLARPAELGFLVDGARYRLTLARRGASFERNGVGRSYLRLNAAEFTRLVLGHSELDEAMERGRLSASTKIAVDMARALFPRLPYWRPPLDELLA